MNEFKLYAKGCAWVPARFWDYRQPETEAEKQALIDDDWIEVNWKCDDIRQTLRHC